MSKRSYSSADEPEGERLIVVPKLYEPLSKLNKYHRRALRLLMSEGALEYSVLAEAMTGLRGNVKGSQRWKRARVALMHLSRAGYIIITCRAASRAEGLYTVVKITTEGWIRLLEEPTCARPT